MSVLRLRTTYVWAVLGLALAYLAGAGLALVGFPTWEAFVAGCAAGAAWVTFQAVVRRWVR